VPAVLVSPWINPGTILRTHAGAGPTNTSQFSHSSVPSTLKNLFNLSTPFLTKRDAWATPFDSLFFQRTTPRTDCPTSIPTPPRKFKSAERKAIEHLQPLNDFQRTLIEVANSLSGSFVSPRDASKLETEQDGGLFIHERMTAFLQRD